VTCQWLANILEKEMIMEDPVVVLNHIPVLPPFNENHTMIDDIGLAKFDTGTAAEPDWEICTEAGNIIVDEKDPLKFYYINELEEWRFDTSLAEIHAYSGSTEIWNWWSIFTKPYQYTELLLPDQENATTDSYEDLGCGQVDGNEYLITTSFIAPNCMGEQRVNLSKSSDERHDIIDRAATLLGGPATSPCPWDFDGSTTIDISDIVILASHWGENWPDGEFSGDTIIDISDIVIVASHWGDCPE
jgi:hypothetical protein